MEGKLQSREEKVEGRAGRKRWKVEQGGRGPDRLLLHERAG